MSGERTCTIPLAEYESMKATIFELEMQLRDEKAWKAWQEEMGIRDAAGTIRRGTWGHVVKTPPTTRGTIAIVKEQAKKDARAAAMAKRVLGK